MEILGAVLAVQLSLPSPYSHDSFLSWEDGYGNASAATLSIDRFANQYLYIV